MQQLTVKEGKEAKRITKTQCSILAAQAGCINIDYTLDGTIHNEELYPRKNSNKPIN